MTEQRILGYPDTEAVRELFQRDLDRVLGEKRLKQVLEAEESLKDTFAILTESEDEEATEGAEGEAL